MHTPGPWHAEKRKFHYHIIASNLVRVTQVKGMEGPGHSGLSDALLIAAAPDMKSALETVLFGLTDDVTNNDGKVDFDGLIKTVKAALEKTEA